MIAPLSPTIMNRATYLSVSVLSIFCSVKDEAELVFRKRIFCSVSVFWAYFIFCVCYWYLGGRPLIKLLCGHPQLLKLSISSPTRNFQTAPTSQTVLYNLSIITSFIYQLPNTLPEGDTHITYVPFSPIEYLASSFKLQNLYNYTSIDI